MITNNSSLAQLSSSEKSSDLLHYRATFRYLVNLSVYFPDRLSAKGVPNG